MIVRLFDYLKFRNGRSNNQAIRLGMNYVVKNEIDIIETAIRTHAKLGVDCFAIMDNNSSDGTREKLSELSSEFDLLIVDQPQVFFEQRKWMTQLAVRARDEQGADFVINNDADEFWLPNEGEQLSAFIQRKDSIIRVPRANMVLTQNLLANNLSCLESEYVVETPFQYRYQQQINHSNASMLFAAVGPKVCTNTHGFVKIKGGNHSARHVWRRVNQRDDHSLRIYHYPFRSKQQFFANVAHRTKVLRMGIPMGPHYQRWAKALDENRLEEEFNSLVLNENQVRCLLELGVLKQDSRPREIIWRPKGDKTE